MRYNSYNQVVITAMNDMNLPKLTSDDSPLFAGIVSDLFPGVETPPLDYGQLYDVIRQQLKENGLQVWSPFYQSSDMDYHAYQCHSLRFIKH